MTHDIINFIQFGLSILMFLIAIASLAVSILSLITVMKINKQQIRREEIQFLLQKIVKTYNLIETDIMLLAQGTFDEMFTRDSLDKEALNAISETKSYAIITKNDLLFSYLDGIITGCAKENMGRLINEYFHQRGKIDKKNIALFGKQIRDDYLSRVRDLRDRTIDKITREFL